MKLARLGSTFCSQDAWQVKTVAREQQGHQEPHFATIGVEELWDRVDVPLLGPPDAGRVTVDEELRRFTVVQLLG